MGSNFVTISCLVGMSILLYNEMVDAKPEYTSEERIAILQFRALVKDDLYKDYMKSNWYLIRWLRARKFNQDEAAFMLRRALKWRKDNKIDGILNEVIYEGVRPFFADGIDYEGSVVATLFASRWDLRSFVVAGKRDIPIRYWSQLNERIEQKILRNVGVIGNKPLEGNATDLTTIIYDLHGYNLRQHACVSCFSVYFEWFEIGEFYYPGDIKHLIFINGPRLLLPLLELMKPLMSEQTAKALKAYGRDKSIWQAAIIGKIVPPDQVRAAFGGTKPE